MAKAPVARLIPARGMDMDGLQARMGWGPQGQISRDAQPPSVEHLQTLLLALSDPSPGVRAMAVEGTVSVASEHERARGTIRRVVGGALVKDPSPRVKKAAAAALAMIGSMQRYPRMIGPRSTPMAPAPTPAPVTWLVDTPTLRPRRGGRRVTARVGELARVRYEAWEELHQRDESQEGDCLCRLCDDQSDVPERLPKLGELPALNLVDEMVRRYHERFYPVSPDERAPQLGDVINPVLFTRLRATLKDTPGEEVPPELRGFARHHGLTASLPAVIDALPALALRGLMRLHQRSAPVRVEWPAIEAALVTALREEPGTRGEVEVVVMAFHEALRDGPEGLREALAKARWTSGWLPLAPWLSGALRLGDTREVMALTHGSWLALSNLRGWLRERRGGLVIDSEQTSGAGVDTFAQVLAAGGGSLHCMDFPYFRVVCRVALVELDQAQGAVLRAIAAELSTARARLDRPQDCVEGLLALVRPALWAELPSGTRERLVATLRRSLVAYVVLRDGAEREGQRLRRSQLVGFWGRPWPEGLASAPQLLASASVDRVCEGLVMALLSEVHQGHGADDSSQLAIKELLIEAARLAATMHGWQPMPALLDGDVSSAATLIDALLRCFEHAPLEMMQAAGLDTRQGLPRLRGGRGGSLEARFRVASREAQRGRRQGAEGEGTVIVCRPIPKEQAIYRGTLGGDCSSRSVPLRALSPHHIYYGIFTESGEQLPGYMTVYEAWAASMGGQTRAVLCLETINEPPGVLGGVQQDLLLIFEAIARSRGLHPGLVLSTHRGTWNFSNGHELASCRRSRRAERVWLSPADPVVWRAYAQTSREGNFYTAFDDTSSGDLLRPAVRAARESMPLLAPFDSALDRVQPENLAEAQRLAALPVGSLRITCRDTGGGVVGFVSTAG